MARIPVGQKYTATMKDERWVPFKCDFCGCKYYYKVKLEASGSADSILWLNNKVAKSKAQERAILEMSRNYREAINESIHCPDCGKYSKNMINKVKRDRSKIFGLYTFFFLFFLGVGFLPQVFSYSKLLGYFIIFVFIVILLFIVVQISKIDPNKNSEKRKGKSFSKNYPVLQSHEYQKIQPNSWFEESMDKYINEK